MKSLRSSLFILTLSLLFGACASSNMAKVEDPYVGEWDYTVKGTPQGTVTGVMTITKNEVGVYKAEMTSSIGSIKLDKVKIEEKSLNAELLVQGLSFFMRGTFMDEELIGTVGSIDQSYPMSAKKKVATE